MEPRLYIIYNTAVNPSPA